MEEHTTKASRSSVALSRSQLDAGQAHAYGDSCGKSATRQKENVARARQRRAPGGAVRALEFMRLLQGGGRHSRGATTKIAIKNSTLNLGRIPFTLVNLVLTRR